VSASFEHSSDAAVRGFSAFFSEGVIFVAGSTFFSAGAILVAGAGVAGVVVCANAELISSSDARAVAAAREDNVIMEHLGLKMAAMSRYDAEPRVNEAGRGPIRMPACS
jgi:hypothetical protein